MLSHPVPEVDPERPLSSTTCTNSIEACQEPLAWAQLGKLELSVVALKLPGITLAQKWQQASPRPVQPGR